VQHRDQQHRDRPPEVEVRADLRHREQLRRAAQVGPDHDGDAGLGERGIAMRDHDRVVVHVGHPGGRVDLLGDLVHSVPGGQPDPEVEELVDAGLVGEEPHRAPDELPDRGGRDARDRQRGEHLLGRVPVRLEGLPAAKVMVVHARDVRRAAVQPVGRSPRGLSLHKETLTSGQFGAPPRGQSRSTRYRRLCHLDGCCTYQAGRLTCAACLI
jgi:hypothetical protein